MNAINGRKNGFIDWMNAINGRKNGFIDWMNAINGRKNGFIDWMNAINGRKNGFIDWMNAFMRPRRRFLGQEAPITLSDRALSLSIDPRSDMSRGTDASRHGVMCARLGWPR
jgi:hypothetical protein